MLLSVEGDDFIRRFPFIEWVKRIGIILLCVTFVLLPFAASETARAAGTPVVFLVTNTNDNGPGSLTQAILDCNSSIATDKIIAFEPGVGSTNPDCWQPLLYADNATVTIHSSTTRTLHNCYFELMNNGKLIFCDVLIKNLPNIRTILTDYSENQIFFTGENIIDTKDQIGIFQKGGVLTLKSTDPGGSLLIRGAGYGIRSFGTILLQSGIVELSNNRIGIFGEDSPIIITGGKVVISSSECGIAGLYSSPLSVIGGTVVVKSDRWYDVYLDLLDFKVTGGSVNARNISCDVTDGAGTVLYLTTVIVGTPPLADTPVTCSINGGASFQAQTDSEGKLYLWIPATDTGKTATVLIKAGTVQYQANGAVAPNYGNIMTAVQLFTVKFNVQGGSDVPSQTVPYGSLVTQPVNPTRTGYTFGGWYKDAAGTLPWNLSSDTVTADTTLYAKWTEVSDVGLYIYMVMMLLFIVAVIFEELYFVD